MSEQIAPYSQEAEEAVLGAVIVNPTAYVTIAAFLKSDDFFFVRHRYIWESLERLQERREIVDYLTVVQELKDMSQLDAIGGPAYITQLISITPSSAHAEIYGRIVERTAVRRRLMEAAEKIRHLAADESLTIESVTSEAEVQLFNVTDRQVKREFTPLSDVVSAYFERVEYLMHNQQDSFGIPSGFRDLDEMLGGFQRSDLLIFAGRPGMGKTSFLLSIAVNIARIGGRVAIFTMEMGADQLVQRILSMETGINSQQMRLGRLTPRDFSLFVEASGRVSDFRIFIDDTPALTPAQMRTKCRRLMHEHGIDMIIVDYLQLMNSGGVYQNNRVQEVSFISRALKELARELNVPMISAAQLSRAVEQRQDKRPVLSDLRESGCLAGESLVFLPDEGRYVPMQDLVGKAGFRVLSINTDTMKLEVGTATAAFSTGIKPIYRLTTQLGRTIRATANHKFLTIEGWKQLDELQPADAISILSPFDHYSSSGQLAANTLVPSVDFQHELAAGSFQLLAEIPQQPVWDTIASIALDGETEVYDLTVEPHHNFAASNIVVHNSIEQDSDIVMFLYRDSVYNEASEFPNQADVIIAKHRNGPTGTISLYFDPALTKFMDGAVRRVDLGDY